jgi:hypothetical protein
VVGPPSYGGGVSFPAFLQKGTLLTSTSYRPNEGDGRDDYSYISTWATPVNRVSSGLRALAGREPIRGPDVYYAARGVTVPHEGTSLSISGIPLPADPHGHEDVFYGGESRGARVVTFGSDHRSPNGNADIAVPRVFDPAVVGYESSSYEDTVLPAAIAEAGCHHPTWAPSGTMFQCCHEQGTLPTKGFPGYKALYGFAWSDADDAWVPYDGRRGLLFPLDGSGSAWFEDLPDSLLAAAKGNLADILPAPAADKDDAGATCRAYNWKFAAFCGSDEFLVAHLACANQAWGEDSFTSQVARDDHPDDVGNLGHVASRAVLIRRADGMHWDLTTLVAEALGVDELATDDPNDRIFATMPTCGPLQRRTFPVVAGGQLNARPHRMQRSDAGD